MVLAIAAKLGRTDRAYAPALDTYRGVQPKALESYFGALGGPNPDVDVPKFLGSRESVAIEKSLQ